MRFLRDSMTVLAVAVMLMLLMGGTAKAQCAKVGGVPAAGVVQSYGTTYAAPAAAVVVPQFLFVVPSVANTAVTVPAAAPVQQYIPQAIPLAAAPIAVPVVQQNVLVQKQQHVVQAAPVVVQQAQRQPRVQVQTTRTVIRR